MRVRPSEDPQNAAAAAGRRFADIEGEGGRAGHDGGGRWGRDEAAGAPPGPDASARWPCARTRATGQTPAPGKIEGGVEVVEVGAPRIANDVSTPLPGRGGRAPRGAPTGRRLRKLTSYPFWRVAHGREAPERRRSPAGRAAPGAVWIVATVLDRRRRCARRAAPPALFGIDDADVVEAQSRAGRPRSSSQIIAPAPAVATRR